MKHKVSMLEQEVKVLKMTLKTMKKEQEEDWTWIDRCAVIGMIMVGVVIVLV